MTDKSALEQKLAELQTEHRDLDEAIAQLSDNPSHDRLKIQRLKKRKLALKDEIARLENLLLPDIIA